MGTSLIAVGDEEMGRWGLLSSPNMPSGELRGSTPKELPTPGAEMPKILAPKDHRCRLEDMGFHLPYPVRVAHRCPQRVVQKGFPPRSCQRVALQSHAARQVELRE